MFLITNNNKKNHTQIIQMTLSQTVFHQRWQVALVIIYQTKNIWDVIHSINPKTNVKLS